jgi:predicted outer membrane repeat protein
MGGAIFVLGGSHLSFGENVESVLFEESSANLGGAIAITEDSSVSFNKSTYSP